MYLIKVDTFFRSAFIYWANVFFRGWLEKKSASASIGTDVKWKWKVESEHFLPFHGDFCVSSIVDRFPPESFD